MITVEHTSEITGSTWIVEFDKDWDVKTCFLKSNAGKLTKVIVSKALDWKLWQYFNKYYPLERMKCCND